MKKLFLYTLLCSIAGFCPYGSARAQGLLTGCTVSQTNTINFGVAGCTSALPPGWTNVLNEGFESGFLGNSDEFINTDNPAGIPGEISTVRAHTGTRSLDCAIPGSESNCTLGVIPGSTLGSVANEIYMSYWQWYDPNGTSTDDNGMMAVILGNRFRDFSIDPNNFNPDYLSPSAGPMLFWYQESSGGDAACYPDVCISQTISPCIGVLPCDGMNGSSPQVDLDFQYGLGAWIQYEYDAKFNTCTGPDPNYDGYFKVWRDGQLLFDMHDANLTGCPSFSGDTTINLEAGGYHSVIWVSDGPPSHCVTIGASEQQAAYFANPTFSDAPTLQTGGQHPGSTCYGSQQTFHMGLDDIIIMKR